MATDRRSRRTRPPAPPLSVAVVGLGYWGPNLVRNLHEVADVRVSHVCDLSDIALETMVRRYPALRATKEFEVVLDDPAVDAVAIATPVSTHFELASLALEAGKHVFVEKPLAGSVAEALELVRVAERNDRVLMPGHTFLYSPAVNLIRGIIQSGDLGQIQFISTSRVNLGLHQPDVSVVWDLGPHDFSILRYWLGETPSHVSALSRSCILPGTPDVAFINVEFPSRTIAHVELSWLAPSKLRRTAIVGSEKMVVYDDTSNEPVRVFDSGVDMPRSDNFAEFKLNYRTGDIVSPNLRGAEPLLLEMTDFFRAIRTGAEPCSSADLGVDVIRIIEAVDHSLDLQGARVEVDALPVPIRRPDAASAVATVGRGSNALPDGARAASART